jgi:hypothetical protein
MINRGENGITLVSLVITIIVLLILAGVAINVALGEGGLIAKMEEAKRKHELEQLKEAVKIKKAELLLAQRLGETVEYPGILLDEVETEGYGVEPEERKNILSNL